MPKFDRFTEDVNGVVIGEITRRVSVFSLNGHEYGRMHFPVGTDDSEMKAWALSVIEGKRAEVGEIESKHLGWDKPWEMRIYE